MQEAILQLEEKLEEIVNKFVESATKAGAPALGEVARHRVLEGHLSSTIQPNGEDDAANCPPSLKFPASKYCIQS